MAEGCFITTSLRSDAILLLSEENAKFSAYKDQRCQFYMLRLHQERLIAAAEALHYTCDIVRGESGIRWLDGVLHEHLENRYGNPSFAEPLKIHVIIDRHGHLSVSQSTPVDPVPLELLFPRSLDVVARSTDRAFGQVFISPTITQPSVYTLHKTSHREMYDFQRALLPDAQNPRAATQYLNGASSRGRLASPEREASTPVTSPPGEENAFPRCDLLDEILLVCRDADHGDLLMEGSITTPYVLRGDRWCTPSRSCGGNLGSTRRWALEAGFCYEGLINIDKISKLTGTKILLSNGVRGFGWATLAPSEALRGLTE